MTNPEPPPDSELHARFACPGWQYTTTEGPRKQWDEQDTPPDGSGWVRNTDAGRDGWERFDYTECSYWRRLVPERERLVHDEPGLAEQATRIRRQAARTAEGNAGVINDIIRMLNTSDRLIAELKAEAVPTEWIGRHGVAYPLNRVLVGADGDRWKMFGWRPDRLTPIFENVSEDVHGLWILDLQEVVDRYGPLSAEATVA